MKLLSLILKRTKPPARFISAPLERITGRPLDDIKRPAQRKNKTKDFTEPQTDARFIR